MKTLAFVTVLIALATPALADPVTLRANPVDADGRVTLGDIFEGASAAANVAVATRSGPSVVMEASQLQSLARQSGLVWTNPQGLRRVVIRNAALSPDAPAPASAPNAAPEIAPAPALPARIASRPVATERVIARNDIVQVAYQVGGVSLTVMGRATRAAGVGEAVAVTNLQSGRIIDAVATGPGRAVAGPAANAARISQLAAR